MYRRERKKRSHKLLDRLADSGNQEPRRRARSGGSRATSATTGSSEDGSSGQHADYDTEVSHDCLECIIKRCIMNCFC